MQLNHVDGEMIHTRRRGEVDVTTCTEMRLSEMLVVFNNNKQCIIQVLTSVSGTVTGKSAKVAQALRQQTVE